MQDSKKALLTDVVIAVVLGLIAAVLFMTSTADYIYPGESAHLAALWNGLDVSTFRPYPLMAAFAEGGTNAIMWKCGVLTTVFLYVLFVFFVRYRISEEDASEHTVAATRVGGVVLAVVFMLTPAVREAASHLEPRLFDFMWAMLAFVLIAVYSCMPKWIGWLFVILSATVAGCGVADSPLTMMLLPLYFVAVWSVASPRGRRPYGVAALFLLVYLLAMFLYVKGSVGDMTEYLQAQKAAVKFYFQAKNWVLVLALATVPFAICLMACRKSLSHESGLSQWMFHLVLTLVTVLTVATPLSPSVLMDASGVFPVATSAFVAITAGYLATYWWLLFKSAFRVNESLEEESTARFSRPIACVAGGVLVVAVVGSGLINLFTFDRDSGRFVTLVAENILAEMGDRTWLVTDGTIDDNLRFAARAEPGRELNIISLTRDADKDYIAAMTELVKEKKIGGENNGDLLLSLSIGVLPFVQDWFAMDTNVSRQVAVFGVPDLWYSAQLTAVPEFLVFGADSSRKPDWSKSEALLKALPAPKGWGSYQLWRETNPVKHLRLELRRYLGLMANDRGVWLQENGNDDKAFKMYDLALETIDRDNISALVNILVMGDKGHPKAAARKRDLFGRLQAIVKDESRRYILQGLSKYYGYIRDAQYFTRNGYAWARSGRPGEALAQVRRALDLVATDNRHALLNMMASLYAADNDRHKSRETYESVLAQDADNHDALMGLMRLELMDCNSEKAAEYLERVTKLNGDDPRGQLELAMLHMMRNELDEAKKVIRKTTDADHGNLQAWSMLAMVTIQQIDATKDAIEAKKLERQLRDEILATMEKQARNPSDYYLQTTRAFILLRQGEDKRRAARDAFAAAAKERPDIAGTTDLVLGLDISLDDKAEAEKHARDVLRRNRKAPLANYVMGSLALHRGQLREAEEFLRRSVNTQKPAALALNDLAEVLRRRKEFAEAEKYARKTVEVEPSLYVAWETLASILLDANKDLDQAEEYVNKAVELSKGADGKVSDIRMVISQIRVLLARKDLIHAKSAMRMVDNRIGELSDYERAEYEELKKSAR